MLTPNKEDYTKAKGIVEKYELRQNELMKIEKELKKSLEEFKLFNFDIDKERRVVYFAGVIEKFNGIKIEFGEITTKIKDELITSKAIANHNEVFEEVIGKLISVKRALDEDYEWVYDYIESYDMYVDGSFGDYDIAF